MSQPLRSHPNAGDRKRQRTAAAAAQSAAAQPSAASLPQLPAAVLSLVYLHLPWFDRLLHLSHIHRQLPPASLVWSESDHVRLSEALLGALEQRSPTAVHCCRHVQSLCVEREVDARDTVDANEPLSLTRLQLCLHNSTTPLFSSLRSFLASHYVVSCLLAHSGLPHLHSLSVHSKVFVNDDRRPLHLHETYTLPLDALPALRRLRLEGSSVEYAQLFALPLLEHIDLRGQLFHSTEALITAPAPPSLHSLLDRRAVVGFGPMTSTILFTALASTSIRHLSIRAALFNADMLTLTTVQSLTSLHLHGCFFDDVTLLSRLVSKKAEPLLPNLQRFAVDDIDTERAINARKLSQSTAAFVRAYSRQLRHLKLAVNPVQSRLVADVLSVAVSSMPQLETLDLQMSAEPVEVLNAITVLRGAAAALPALRSLSLCGLAMSDMALEQLLSCCPHLLELRIAYVGPLTAALWSSLRHCRQLLSLCYSAPVLQPHTAFRVFGSANATIGSTLSAIAPQSPPLTAAFLPCLTHLSLQLDLLVRNVSPLGFQQLLLRHFERSPIATVALSLNHTSSQIKQIVRHLAALPHLTSLALNLAEVAEDGSSTADQTTVTALFNQCTQQLTRPSSGQHHVNMQHYWRDGLLGEEEAGEMRAKYAAGVRPAFCLYDRPFDACRSFKRAASEGEEDGRMRFFRLLESSVGEDEKSQL